MATGMRAVQEQMQRVLDESGYFEVDLHGEDSLIVTPEDSDKTYTITISEDD